MKNILITGITGFIGKNLKRYLQNTHKYQIWGVSRNSNDSNHINFNNIDSSGEFDAYIHLAGKAHDLKNSTNPQEYYEVNTDLTIKLFDLFLSSKSDLFIFLSSVKAVKDNTNSVLSEEAIPNPFTDYGKSKRLAEEYILSNLPQTKRVYILRPCMVHGDGNKGNLTLLYKFVKKGIPYPLGAFDNKRSFLSIENLCFVIKELIERDDIPSGVYHLADDEPIDTKSLIKLINKTTNKNVPIWNLPKSLIKIIGKIGEFLPLPINTERIEKLTENYVVSNQKIKNALRKKLPISTQAGLIRTIKSFEK